MRIVKVFQWDAAHKLCLPYESKCNNMHGHTYKVEIEMDGPLNDDGMVMDFKTLKSWVEGESFDHMELNQIPEFKDKNPTAEHLVLYLHDKLEARRGEGPPYIRRVRVWETPTSYAEEVWDISHTLILKHILEDNDKKRELQKSLEESTKLLEAVARKIKERA